MFSLRRWWDRFGLRVGLIALALSGAWLLRQTQGTFVLELYQVLAKPFQGKPAQQEILQDAAVRELQDRLIELESQNQQLRSLLDYQSSLSEKGIVAPVIGRSPDHWWQLVTLGRGSSDDIQVGAIVSGTGGIVGRVIQVTPNTSRVLLVSDPSSQVGVTISRSRSMGYMRGQARNRAVMEFFDKVPDVRPGDVVSTSSFSQLFPAGMPIGRIESVNLDKSPVPEATIEISAPISYLEWVIVSPNPLKSSIEELN